MQIKHIDNNCRNNTFSNLKVVHTISNWVCPKCGSRHINNVSFDFYNFCLDCGYEWEAV